eukprot:INCI19661.1.p1 GENE.INCI19661.1~~INCI19661.1.p1  ORF type:complete len:363 (-),score=62.29 INCI19661.1:461-1435(-)
MRGIFALLSLCALATVTLANHGPSKVLKSFLKAKTEMLKHGAKSADGSLPYTPYLILMETGSVGSSWLTHVLDSHPKIVSMGERTTQVLGLQNHILGASQPIDADTQAVGIKVKRDRLRGRSPLGKFYDEKGHEAFGSHPDSIPALLHMLNKTDAKLICLVRRNFVKHAVSQVRHHQQAHIGCGWETTKDSCVKKLAGLPLTNFESLSQYVELLEMDVNDTLSICDEYAKMTSHKDEDFAHSFAYEDLVYGENTGKLFAEMQEFLHVDPIDIVSHYNQGQKTIKKITPVDLSAYLVNFDEVDAYMKTRYGEDSREYELFSSKHS